MDKIPHPLQFKETELIYHFYLKAQLGSQYTSVNGKFEIHKVGQGKYTFKSLENGKYLQFNQYNNALTVDSDYGGVHNSFKVGHTGNHNFDTIPKINRKPWQALHSLLLGQWKTVKHYQYNLILIEV